MGREARALALLESGAHPGVLALGAGFVATVVMSAMMKMASAAGMTHMPPMPLVTGAMFSGYRDTATKIASDKASGIYVTWNDPQIHSLAGVCAASSLLFLAVAYLVFCRRDLNI